MYAVLKTVAHAFSSSSEYATLLDYVTAHITLSKKRKNRRKWVDEVYELVSKNCFLVKNLVKQFNQVQGNGRASRDERIRILSSLADGFSYNTVVSLRMCVPTSVCVGYNNAYVYNFAIYNSLGRCCNAYVYNFAILSAVVVGRRKR